VLKMKEKAENKWYRHEKYHEAGASIYPSFVGRFTCGTGPDEEPDGFQNAVSGFLRKGNSQWEAKKAAEACFRALAKL